MMISGDAIITSLATLLAGFIGGYSTCKTINKKKIGRDDKSIHVEDSEITGSFNNNK